MARSVQLSGAFLVALFLALLLIATGSAWTPDARHIGWHDHAHEQGDPGSAAPLARDRPAPPAGGRSSTAHLATSEPSPVDRPARSATAQTFLPTLLTPKSTLAPYRIANPYTVPGVFRKAQFHLHTANSFDGHKEATPEATARAFKLAGYTFLVFTDHDVPTRFTAHNDDTFVTVVGYESTGNDGHIGAWFTSTVVNPRLPPQRRIDGIRRTGGLAALNHPTWDVRFSVEQPEQLKGYQALEIYNHVTDRRTRRLEANLEKWRQALNHKGPGQPVWGIAVSDAHDAFTRGGWTMVKTAVVSAEALREAIVRGSLYATSGPEFPSIEVVGGEIVVEAAVPSGSDLDTNRAGRVANATGIRRIRFFDQDGRTGHEVGGAYARYRPSGDERWVRVEAEDFHGQTAWSQPLCITPS